MDLSSLFLEILQAAWMSCWLFFFFFSNRAGKELEGRILILYLVANEVRFYEYSNVLSFAVVRFIN
jgi:hypothetical protein